MARKYTRRTIPTPEAPSPVPPRIITFSRSLRVNLTDAEIAQRADRAAHKLADAVARTEELKASTKHQKGVIDSIMSEVHDLSGEVRTRSTYRMTECQRVYDYETAMVREVRTDTDEVMDERRMTEAERQRELPFDESKERPDEADDHAANEAAEEAAEEGDDF